MLFEFHKEILVKVGILRESNQKTVTMIAYIGWILLMSCFISSLIFVIKFNAINLESSLFAMLQVSAVAATLYSLAVIHFHRHQIPVIAEQFEKNQGKFSTT